MSWFRRRRRALVCQQAVELMSDYLEGALSPADAARLEAHLVDCPHCTEYLAQLRAGVTIAGRVEPAPLDPDTEDALVEMYRRWQA